MSPEKQFGIRDANEPSFHDLAKQWEESRSQQFAREQMQRLLPGVFYSVNTLSLGPDHDGMWAVRVAPQYLQEAKDRLRGVIVGELTQFEMNQIAATERPAA
jgi:hypothetical protein